jgi:hypothetical protein
MLQPAGSWYEIHLNREGVNSIEVPGEPAVVETGSPLMLELINHGSPLHLTIFSNNIAMFSEFSYENIYVDGTSTLTIPIRPESYPGMFNLDIITGYGARRESFGVIVKEARPPVVPGEGRAEGSRFTREAFLFPIATGLSLLLYLAGLFLRNDLFNAAAFLVLLGGALSVWYSQR